ncbi:hypothetical protein RND71_006483 [Anisodus tanguticus]|uniref:SWIM-type domain-containing protein n=1 Tax=Anisodus tanguticus TaxID=243964 RepID=A0AAE1VT88_9SOLA|nr:hypothetical protein RND71_006483 [Anisodus tanguticus]
MVKGKLILICQSGGEFVSDADGNLSYNGGEANAVNINQDTPYDDLKIKLAEMCNLELKTVSIKYFLPRNRKTLINLRSEKDFKRMVEFHANSVTVEIFVSGKEGFDRDALNTYTDRTIGLKLVENVNHHGTPDSGGLSTTPSKATPLRTVRTAAASPIAIQSDCLVDVHISCQEPDSPSQATTSSDPSSGHVAEDDSDYSPRSRAQSPISFDYDATPADTVKKRRRTASLKIGANGPTIIVTDNDSKEKISRKKSRSSTGVMVRNDMVEDEDSVQLPDNFDSSSPIALRDEDLPEKLVATWKEGITGVGQDFKSVKEFRSVLQKYVVAHCFVYKLKKNDASRVSGRCVVEGCSWKIHASRVPSDQTFRIRKFNDLHTCGGESWKSAHRTRNWLVSIIKERLRDSPNDKPREIAKSILRDFGIKLRYSQVWRGMEDAKEQLQGLYSKSYNRLPWFCEKVVNTNPGTVVKLVLNDEKRLQRFFFSLHASVHGFKHGCRPLVFLEATSLRSKYKETLMTATGVDADDGFFPVAFAVIDTENDDSWRWFLEQLKSALSTSQSITFISDREKNLKNSVLEVFENASHGYSIFHLLESFKRNMKGPFHGDGRVVLPEIFLAAAHAVRLSGFKQSTEQIKQICSHAYDWLIQIEPECWTSLSFKGQHYNYITENVADPCSKLIEESRGSTIMQKIEALICMLGDLIDHRKSESSNWSTKLTPSKETKIQKEAVKTRGLKVLISSDVLFEVHDEMTHVVNIENHECTCLEWKQSGLPCCHAVAVFNYIGKCVYDYCSSYFTVESYHSTYSASVNPIPGIGTPVEEDGESDTADVLPPCPPESPVEEKPEETKSVDPNKRTVLCSRCKEPGHNKASCKATL